ncbi:MAG: flagellar basal body L-ring protein FlgH [Sandaracinaceae bacterium]|nr:flagellar basal body L-ring protein FlgH [Sandaracinaceae bacterium]
MSAVRHLTALAALVVAFAGVGCGEVQHIRTHHARQRDYDPGQYAEAPHAVSSGSLWLDGSRGLFADFRAARAGDLVTVVIDENPRATGDATTRSGRESSFELGVNGLFGLTAAMARAYPDLDPEQLVGLVGSSSFEGGGSTARSSRLRASVAVRVRRVLPNGDLFVEGTKVLLVNEEELHLYISGVVRPADIVEDNSVSSSRLADAEIEFSGRGGITDSNRPGWLHQLLMQISPL